MKLFNVKLLTITCEILAQKNILDKSTVVNIQRTTDTKKNKRLKLHPDKKSHQLL